MPPLWKHISHNVQAYRRSRDSDGKVSDATTGGPYAAALEKGDIPGESEVVKEQTFVLFKRLASFVPFLSLDRKSLSADSDEPLTAISPKGSDGLGLNYGYCWNCHRECSHVAGDIETAMNSPTKEALYKDHTTCYETKGEIEIKDSPHPRSPPKLLESPNSPCLPFQITCSPNSLYTSTSSIYSSEKECSVEEQASLDPMASSSSLNHKSQNPFNYSPCATQSESQCQNQCEHYSPQHETWSQFSFALSRPIQSRCHSYSRSHSRDYERSHRSIKEHVIGETSLDRTPHYGRPYPRRLESSLNRGFQAQAPCGSSHGNSRAACCRWHQHFSLDSTGTSASQCFGWQANERQSYYLARMEERTHRRGRARGSERELEFDIAAAGQRACGLSGLRTTSASRVYSERRREDGDFAYGDRDGQF